MSNVDQVSRFVVPSSSVKMSGVEDSDLLQLTQEALDLATTACHFDREENFVGAYDYYDKCILNIDEIISKLPPTTASWRKLMEIRSQYDDRMDQLKEMEQQRSTLTGSFSLSSSTTGTSQRTFLGRKKKKNQEEEFQFQEISFAEFSYEEPPNNPLEIPFWQLRNIARSMETGAFLTKSLFVCKNVWQQSDVKFSGFNAKTAAFEIITNLIINEAETLYRLHDEDSIALAETTFYNIEEELNALRNQLAKSFPYIKDRRQLESGGAGAKTGGDITSSPVDPTGVTGSNHGTTPLSATPSPTPMVPGSGSENVAADSAGNLNPPSGSSSSKVQNKSLTGMVTAFGKSMKKYAEVGLHRLAVALPTRLSSEDLIDYKNRIIKLSEKSQVFICWIRYIQGLKNGQLTPEAHLFPSAMELVKEGDKGIAVPQPVALPAYVLEKVLLIDQSLIHISQTIRDIVCEILLRDVEYLLDRYLHHTRKAVTRMQWDQDYSSSSDV